MTGIILAGVLHRHGNEGSFCIKIVGYKNVEEPFLVTSRVITTIIARFTDGLAGCGVYSVLVTYDITPVPDLRQLELGLPVHRSDQYCTFVFFLPSSFPCASHAPGGLMHHVITLQLFM